MIDHNAVLEMVKLRIAPREIAKKLNLTPEQVYWSKLRARGLGHDIPAFSRKAKRAAMRNVPLQPNVRDMLKPHAAARSTSVTELAQTLLATIAQDGMVDAVLDDGDHHVG